MFFQCAALMALVVQPEVKSFDGLVVRPVLQDPHF